jgi:hypothetical protein
MSGAATPPVLLVPIGSTAGSGFITNPLPETPTGTNAASIAGGFPAIVMQAELSGGLPPLGQDMNGYFFLISSHTLYVECGQTYQFNATLAGQIGGYLAGTILGMADGTGLWLCVESSNTANPDTGGAGWVPIAAYGTAVVAVTGGTIALTAAQSKYGVVILTGILTSNLAVQFPQTVQEWLVINATSGSFTTTLLTAHSGSTGVAISQGGYGAPLGVYSVGDGNIYPTVAPLNLPIDQNPTASTIVQRTNAGYVLATYFNQNSPLENPTIGAVFVQNSAADGYLRKIGLTNFEGQLLLQGMGGALTNGQAPYSVVQQWASALFSSAALTGVPTAPTAPAGTSSTQIATTAFANPVVTVTGNGICITFSNGYKLQAGGTNPAGGTSTVTFPVPFTSQAYPVSVAINNGGAVQCWIRTFNLAGMSVSTSGGSAIWIAVGI